MTSIVWDRKVPGLGIRKNAKSDVWILKYRVKERQLMISLGPVHLLDNLSARALAKRMKWEGKKGIGPAPKPRKSGMTLARFSEEYIERYAKLRKKSWLKDKQRLDRYVLPALGKRLLCDLKRSEVARFHDEIGKRTPRAANLVVQQLHRMFTLAIAWGYLPDGVLNPAAGLDMYPNARRTRWLREDELRRVYEVLATLPQHKSTFFKLLLMTGCRSSEIRFLRWCNVDLKKGTLTLDDTKNGEPHWLPLPGLAVELLKALPRDQDNVFPGFREDKCWAKVRKEAGVADVRIHDLRHTAASMLLQSGHSLRVVGEVLNHKSLQATHRYAHLAREHLRSPLEQLAELLPGETGS